MEGILHSPSPCLPILSSSLTNHPTQPRRTHLQHSITNQTHRSPLRAQALNNALSIAAIPPAETGDTSVLIPISAVLLFAYWIANFVVPEIVTKDLQQKAAPMGEETGEEQQASNSAANVPGKRMKKIKKEDLKKMIRPR